MKAIENEKLLNVCMLCGAPGFNPKLTYNYDTSSKKLTVTDASDFPSGDSLEIINVITTVEGKDYLGSITSAGGNVQIDLSTANTTKGFNITATIVSKNRLTADLAAYEVASNVGSGSGTMLENGEDNSVEEKTENNKSES